MKKLAIIGASYLQAPLIQRAKEMGIETHVFAWAANDVGEKMADYFYPISVVEKDEILNKCKDIQIDGICSVASDLAAITVNYVADKMGLIGNSLECVSVSTNKHKMRLCFEKNGDPSPKSIWISGIQDLRNVSLCYPVIVKPVDRSGSRGITKLENALGLEEAIERAKQAGFEKAALVEEYATGTEYSVEFISWKGQHTFLSLTRKFTTGSPHFIETGHFEPASVDLETIDKIKRVTIHALDSLGIEYGASHTELKLSEDGNIKIIEIGGRMGGDFIGSSLVELSTGIDFVGAVINIALGEKPQLNRTKSNVAGVRFIFSQDDIDVLNKIKANHPDYIVKEEVNEIIDTEVTDSSGRFGYYIMTAERLEQIEDYLPWNESK